MNKPENLYHEMLLNPDKFNLYESESENQEYSYDEKLHNSLKEKNKLYEFYRPKWKNREDLKYGIEKDANREFFVYGPSIKDKELLKMLAEINLDKRQYLRFEITNEDIRKREFDEKKLKIFVLGGRTINTINNPGFTNDEYLNLEILRVNPQKPNAKLKPETLKVYEKIEKLLENKILETLEDKSQNKEKKIKYLSKIKNTMNKLNLILNKENNEDYQKLYNSCIENNKIINEETGLEIIL